MMCHPKPQQLPPVMAQNQKRKQAIKGQGRNNAYIDGGDRLSVVSKKCLPGLRRRPPTPRGSDALYGWMFDSLQGLGLKLGAIALCALPVAAGWLVLSAALGRVQERRAVPLGAVAVQGD
jgi:hypothetical protein